MSCLFVHTSLLVPLPRKKLCLFILSLSLYGNGFWCFIGSRPNLVVTRVLLFISENSNNKFNCVGVLF